MQQEKCELLEDKEEQVAATQKSNYHWPLNGKISS